MMYKAYIKQEGEGCDYTIACGETIIHLKALTPDQAMLELNEIIVEDYNSFDNRLESVVLYEISNTVDFDIKGIYKRLKLMEKEANNKLKNEAELAEYERLRLKFEK